MPLKTVLEAVNEALREEMRRDPEVFVLGEDVGTAGGVFLATQGLIQEFGPQRVMDTPLAEAAIAGVAIGAAMAGMRPVAEIQFCDFILPAVEQLVAEASRVRYRSNGRYTCPMVVRTPMGGGVRGGLSHSLSLEAMFTNVPGLKVVAPATPYDTKGLLKAAIRDPDPVIFMEHKKTYRSVRGEVPDGDYTVPLGVADVKREGDAITVLAYSLGVHYALEAAEELAREGVEVEVVDLRTLVPLDVETVLASARKTGKVLVVQEASKTGGFGAELAALVVEHAFDHLDGPVLRVAGPDIPSMPFNAPQEDFFMINPEKIAAGLRTLAAY